MIDASPQDLTTIKRILAKHLPECEVRAFGSRVSWTAKPYSDLDLVVLGPKKLSRKVLTLIKSAFEESAIPITVDVLDWHRISPEFRENIEKEYETVQTPDEWNAIPEGWRFRKVSEIAEVVGGGTPKTKKPEYWGGDISWLTPKDLSGEHFRYVSRGERNITKAGLENSSARLVPPETVLLTSRAPVGYVAMAKNPIATNQGFRSLVVDEEHDPDFIYYLLLHNTDYLKQHASGSTFQELSASTLKSLEFLIPPLSEQRAIAHILGSLDDKIELNRRMNMTLRAMARAIFKSWFVDFDPVRTKAEGRDTGLPKEVADFFPDRFEDSELGEIPKGWEPSTLGSEFNLTMGQSPPGKTYNETGEGLPFFQGRRDFGFRFPTNRVYCTAPKRFAEHGDTLVSVRAPVGDINMATERCCVGRGVARIRHKSGSRSYTYYAMHSLCDRFSRFEAEGTVFGAINKKQFEGMRWLFPPTLLILKFEEIAFPFDERIEKNILETETLASLRDTLLPKLLSGELRVPDAEKFMEGVA
jgi:type I restriction enzyme S subunit